MQMESDRLANEVEQFTSYLLGRPAGEYVRNKYREFHASAEGMRMLSDASAFDRFLVDFALGNSLRIRISDSYTLFHRDTLLRKKLVLTAALLECSPAHYELLDRVNAGSASMIALRLTARVVMGAVFAIAGAAVLLPVRWSMRIRAGRRQQQPC